MTLHVAGGDGGSRGLIGRAEEVSQVEAALATGGGCVVAGPAGVGKSRLAAEVASGRGGTIAVFATASAASIPFGAFGHLLRWDRVSAASVIPAYIERIRTDHPQGPPVIVVDDAHLLDDPSAALVLALVTTGVARPLLTLRTPEREPDAVTALWKDRGLPRIELQPLGRIDIRALVVELLGGDVHAGASERICDLSQGNPLYVVELLHDARRTGALYLRDGRWRWREDLLELDRLSVLVGRRLRDVSADAAHALELVAVAGSLPAAMLASMVGDQAIEELERVGLVSLRGQAAQAELVPAHPLFGEVAAASLPRTARARLARELADGYRRRGQLDEDERLRVAALMMGSGDGDPEMYVDASAIAMRRGGPGLALRLAERAGEGFLPATARAVALIGLARFDEAAAVLAPWRDAAAAAAEAPAMEFVENRFRSLLCGTAGDAAVSAVLDDAQSWHASADWSAFIATQRSWVVHHLNRPAEALEALEPWIGDEPIAIATFRRFHVLAAAFYSQLRLGRIDDALASAEAINSIVSSMATGPWETRYGQLVFAQFPRIDAARDLPAVERAMTESLTAAASDGDGASRVVATMGLGLVALRRGHAERAARHLGDAADALETADPALDGLETLTRLALAQALRGDQAAAARALTRAEVLGRAQPRVARRLAGDLEHARLMATASGGNLAMTAERLLALADSRLENPTLAANIIYDALRLGAGPRRVAGALSGSISQTQNDLVAVLVAHAEALAAGDAEGQMNVAGRFAIRGLDLYAAETAARAARAFARFGRVAQANAARSMSEQHRRACGPVDSPVLSVPVELPELTPRELEVARLAASGMTNRAIAETLVISTRTVESCVLRACRKLGVESRRSLADVLSRET